VWPNQTLPLRNAKILPLRVFIQETIRRSRTSFSTLQLALYYLLRIKSAVREFEIKNPDWFNGPCNFGKTAAKHPIACGRRMFLAAVIVASKYLQDRNYSNRAWAKISGLPVKEINANEFVFLNVAKYDLYVGEALYKRWSGVLLNHVMATVSVSTAAATQSVGLATPPLTPVMSPMQSPTSGAPVPNPNALRMALAQRFCEAIKALSPQLTETELSNLNVLGFTSPQQKPMSPPPSRSGPLPSSSSSLSAQRPYSPPFPLNPLLQPTYNRLPSYETALTPPSSASDSASDSDVWSPKSSVSSASSNDSATNISPRTNIGRCYLKALGCANTSNKTIQSIFTSSSSTSSSANLTKRCASPLSIIAACNDRKRTMHPMVTDSPMSMIVDDTRPPNPPATPRLHVDATPLSAIDSEEPVDWSSAAGTIDPKLLHLPSSALTAVRGLCSLSQRATVFPSQQCSMASDSTTSRVCKRTFGKSYTMGHVQCEYEGIKRRRGAISDQTLARILWWDPRSGFQFVRVFFFFGWWVCLTHEREKTAWFGVVGKGICVGRLHLVYRDIFFIFTFLFVSFSGLSFIHRVCWVVWNSILLLTTCVFHLRLCLSRCFILSVLLCIMLDDWLRMSISTYKISECNLYVLLFVFCFLHSHCDLGSLIQATRQ